MGHSHHHGHSHSHVGAQSANQTRLAWTLALTLIYLVAEIIGGYLADSLSLLADAGHMFSDAAALGLSLFATWIARRPPTPSHSYGFHRAEILAALANGATLIAISIVIFIEAFHRLRAPEEVKGPLMMGIAAGGLGINLIGLMILSGGKDHSLNMRGAWLHLLTDALGSVAALSAGALVWAFGWNWADSLASIAIGLLVIYSSWDLVRQAIAILMQSTPAHLDVQAVEQAMRTAEGVCEVHDLHIWTVTSGMESLSAHVTIDPAHLGTTVLESLRQILHDRFGIDHITIQIELSGGADCRTSF